jgi:hypothetical protein
MNCLLKHVIEGKAEGRIEVIGRWGRRHKQLLNDLKEVRRYWKLKEETQDSTPWRTQFGRGLRTCCTTDYITNDWSVAIWLCYVVLYAWCSTISSAYKISVSAKNLYVTANTLPSNNVGHWNQAVTQSLTLRVLYSYMLFSSPDCTMPIIKSLMNYEL